MQSIEVGIPKQSLGTRNRGRHSQTEFGNEEIHKAGFWYLGEKETELL